MARKKKRYSRKSTSSSTVKSKTISPPNPFTYEDSNSKTSPFKGFNELSTDKENFDSCFTAYLSGTLPISDSPVYKDSQPELQEDLQDEFDKLLNSNIKCHFSKKQTIKTYENRKSKSAETTELLQFEDNENKEAIIKWLNDTRNAFDRTSQTQATLPFSEEIPTFDLPSISQQKTSSPIVVKAPQKLRLTRKKSYNLRNHRSFDNHKEAKKNFQKVLSHSIAGDTPASFENYHIEEFETDDEVVAAPLENTQADTQILMSMMEEEYLNTLNDDIQVETVDKKNGWDRICEDKKMIKGQKQPKKLKVVKDVVIVESPQEVEEPEEEIVSTKCYDNNDFEAFCSKTIQDLVQHGLTKVQPDVDPLNETIRLGNEFLTNLKKVPSNDQTEELKQIIENISICLVPSLKKRVSNNNIEIQTDTSTFCHKVVQVNADLNNVEVQTNENVIEKCDVFIQTETSNLCHKSIQVEEVEEEIAPNLIEVQDNCKELENKNSESENIDEWLGQVQFDSNDILNELQKNESSSRSALVVEYSAPPNEQVNKRTRSPLQDDSNPKRPCNRFMKDLSVDFDSCALNTSIREELIDESDHDQAIVENNNKMILEDKSVKIVQLPSQSDTQDIIDECEMIINNATKPKHVQIDNKQSLSPELAADNNDLDYFRTDIELSRSMERNEESINAKSVHTEEKGNNISASIYSTNTTHHSTTRADSQKCDAIRKSNEINITENILIKPADNPEMDCDEVIEGTPHMDASLILTQRNDLDVSLPPPIEFCDSEEVTIVPGTPENSPRPLSNAITKQFSPKRVQRIPNKVTSTPCSNRPESEPLTLSPINNIGKLSNNIHNLRKTPSQQMVASSKNHSQSSIYAFLNRSIEKSQSALNRSNNGSQTNKPWVTCSRLDEVHRVRLLGLSTKKIISYTSSFSNKITHLVIATDENNQAKDHTMKYVSAVAAGIWVLNTKWIDKCLEMQGVANEEEFEVLDVSGSDGPRRSRLRGNCLLLKGFKIHLAPSFVTSAKQDVERLIKCLGGKLVANLDALLDKDNSVRLIITEASASPDFEMYENWLRILQVITVDLGWLSRVIGEYKLVPFQPYILCPDDTLDDLGYPAELLFD